MYAYRKIGLAGFAYLMYNSRMLLFHRICLRILKNNLLFMDGLFMCLLHACYHPGSRDTMLG